MKVSIALAGALFVTLCAAHVAPAASPASNPALGAIPEAELIRIGKIIEPDPTAPPITEPTRRRNALLAQMGRFIDESRALEAKYPNAPNLYVIRLGILRASGIVFKEKKDLPSRKLMVAAAQSVLDSPAPPVAKVYPDRIVTAETIQPLGGKPADNPEELIRAFVARYADTPAAASALIEGHRLAIQVRLIRLAAQFVATLEKTHLQDAGVLRFLAEIGRRPAFGATLTRLDRTQLVLPADMKGKIVVLEFWATWEPACAANQPVLRKLRSLYKDQGVEIVSISLDEPGRLEDLKQYVRDAGLPWTHTYSGLREDPTAKRCSVEALPSIWVLDRQGRVASVTTGGPGLAKTLDAVLAEP